MKVRRTCHSKVDYVTCLKVQHRASLSDGRTTSLPCSHHLIRAYIISSANLSNRTGASTGASNLSTEQGNPYLAMTEIMRGPFKVRS